MGVVIEVIQDLIERHKTKVQCKSAYEQITDELYDYSLVLDEVIKLKEKTGHTHIRTKEVEEKILRLIDEDDRVLTIKNCAGENIGMQACRYRLENVVLRALDNEEANTQVDLAGENIGMFAARYRLENAVIKALNNQEASIQRNNLNSWNIGMFAAENYLENAVIKALDNPVASIQQNSVGDNIGMMAAKQSLENAVIKALDNDEACKQHNYNRHNIGIISVRYGLEDATIKAMDNDFIRNSQDANGVLFKTYIRTSNMKDAKLKLNEYDALDNIDLEK